MTPDQPNAVKFETFVFDALPFAKNPLILEADRGEEFSPVKNMTGVDSLESSRADQIQKAKNWLSKAGHKYREDSIVEICPKSFPYPEDIQLADTDSFDLQQNEIYLGY